MQRQDGEREFEGAFGQMYTLQSRGTVAYMQIQEILLDWNQSNVILARIIVFFLYFKLFLFFRLALEKRRLILTRLILQ